MVYRYLAAKARRTTPHGPKCSNTPDRNGCKARGAMGYMPLCHRELGSSRKVAHRLGRHRLWNVGFEQLSLNVLDAQGEPAIAADLAQTLFRIDRLGAFVVASSSFFDLQVCRPVEVGLSACHFNRAQIIYTSTHLDW